MAENLELKHQINVPFAENGNKYPIPDTSSDGSVNMDIGLGARYDTPPAKGGLYTKPELINSIIYPIYAAVKELQDIAITAGFPINMQNAINTLNIKNGGTGANNTQDARKNLGLGELATKSSIATNDIDNKAITNAKIAEPINIKNGGTGTIYGGLGLISIFDIAKIYGSVTTQNIIGGLINNGILGCFNTGFIWQNQTNNCITDLPFWVAYLTVNMNLDNSGFLEAYYPLKASRAIGSFYQGKFSGWTIILDKGKIPNNGVAK